MNDTATIENKEKRLRISEAFYSIEGEGPLTGVPTVFIRTFGCNFTCSGFSNPTGEKVIPIQIDTLEKFKPTVGCDSIYAWHPKYKELAIWHTISQLASHIVGGLLSGTVRNKRSGQSPVLSLTGGEPTMHQDALAQLIHHPDMRDFDKILIETNAAYDLKESFIQSLQEWQNAVSDRLVIWACSPKLSISGEPYHKAIRPEIIRMQQQVAGSLQYLKFVSDGSVESFEEIVQTVKTYNEYLAQFTDTEQMHAHTIYVMPVGATSEQQSQNQRRVADMCLEYGYSFCIRAHCFVYNNEVGT